MPPAGYFCHQTKVPKSWLRGFPPEYPLGLPVGGDSLSELAGAIRPAARVEIGKGLAAPDPRDRALPRRKRLDFNILSFSLCTAGRKPDRTANQSTPPQEPAAKREGRVHSGSHCLVSAGIAGVIAPGHFARTAELRRQPKREFLEPQVLSQLLPTFL